MQLAILHKKSVLENRKSGTLRGIMADILKTTIWSFLRAVAANWVALMGGGAIIVLLGIGERISGRDVPLYVYIGLLILFTIFACFLAWRDERRKFIQTSMELEKKHLPQFMGTIHQVSVGVAGKMVNGKPVKTPNVAAVTILASVRNLGMPSIARSWSLLAKVPQKRTLNGELQFQERRLVMHQEGHDSIVHQNEDVLYNKIAEKPLIAGGEVAGVLHFHLHGVTKEDVYRDGSVFVLIFEDVTEKTYFATHVLRTGEGVPKRLPGMKSTIGSTLNPDKRRYQIERLKELIRESESFSDYMMPLTREGSMRRRSFNSKAETFLTQYYDEPTAQRFKAEGIQLLHELLSELL